VRPFWKQRREIELETQLRANRPQPRADFVQTLAGRIHERARRPRPALRPAFAGGITALMLVALVAAGGLHQAGSAVHSVAVTFNNATSGAKGPGTVQSSPAQEQYKPGKGCGDQNHLHDRKYQCKASVGDASIKEGNSGTTNMPFTVSLDGSPLSAVSVGYTTANGTATAGSDYLPTAGTLVFGIGQSTQTVSVKVLGDTVVEGNETMVLNLTSVSANGLIADGQGVGTIVNDDKR
jgi:hypothetical protein